MNIDNLFAAPNVLPQELVDVLFCSAGPARVERIVSQGHASPPGFWYDQAEHEWVALLQGEAALELEGEPPLVLRPGDHCFLPAHVRHRIIWTAPDGITVWLAVFFADLAQGRALSAQGATLRG